MILLRLKKMILIEQTINYYLYIKTELNKKIKINIKIYELEEIKKNNY